MTEEIFYKGLYLVICIVAAICYAWPKLKANNIFMKSPSRKYSDLIMVGPLPVGTSPRKKVYGKRNNTFNCINFLVFTVSVDVLGIGFNVFDGDNAINLFAFSLFLFLTALLGQLFYRDPDYANYPEVKFVLKAWCVSLGIASAIVVFILLFQLEKPFELNSIIQSFFYVLVISFGWTIAPAAVLAIAMGYINNYKWPLIRKRLAALLIGELLTLAITLAVFHQVIGTFRWVSYWLPYAIFYGIGLLFFELKPEPLMIAEGVDIEQS